MVSMWWVSVWRVSGEHVMGVCVGEWWACDRCGVWRLWCKHVMGVVWRVSGEHVVCV